MVIRSNMVYTLEIETPRLLIILVLNFEQVHFTSELMCQKNAGY